MYIDMHNINTSIIVIQVHGTCSSLHTHITETMTVVENLLKKLVVKNAFIEKTYVKGTHWNSGSSIET